MPITTLSQAINSAISLEMERDPNIYMAGEDIASGAFNVTAGLVEKFGEKRIRNTPITESAIIGSAVGAAACGLRPIVEIMFVDFIGVAMDQLFNQAAKMKYMFGGNVTLPIVVRTSFGAGFGAAAQHSQSLEAWFMHIPGLKVVMPSSAYDAKGLFITSVRDDNPVVFLEHRGLYFTKDEVPEEAYTIELGKADIKRQGNDLTIVATGKMVHYALTVAEKSAADGVEIEVIDPRTLSPLDEETILESVKKTNRLIVAHEEVKFAGSGAEIAALVAEKGFDYLDAPIVRVGAPFTPVPFTPVLEKEFIPTDVHIEKAVKQILG